MPLTIKFIRYILVSILLLSVVACDKPEVKALSAHATILAFGASLTQGVGAKHTPYPEALAKLTGLNVINAGVSGETTDKALVRLAPLLKKVKPELLILLAGGNDILQQRDLIDTKKNIAAMIELAQQQGITVVLIGIPERLLFSSAAPLYKALAQEYQLLYDGKLIAQLLHKPKFKSDQVHFNDAGYQQMAESIYTLLKGNGILL